MGKKIFKVGDKIRCVDGDGAAPGVMREGVVLKAMDKDFSFKVVSNHYLLAKG
jgi:hypothetical protein